MRQLLIFELILLTALSVSSQQNMLQFKQLTTDNGLSNSQVVSILQDYKGFMWIGTYSGLNRYDGKNFVIYKNIPDDSTSICGNVAKAIFEDNKKRLFIGTFQGLSMYNRDLDCFVNFGLDKFSVLYQIEMSIFSIAGDTLGNLWIGSSDGLLLFNVDNNTLIRFNHNPNDPTSLSNDFVENVFLDSKQRLWVSTHKGLNVFNTKIGTFDNVRPFLMPNDIHNNKFYNSAIEDKTGNLWFGTYEGLFCYENNLIENNIVLSHYSNDPANTTSLSHNYIVSLFVDDDNKLWIGTENGGINLFNRESKTFFHYRIDEFNSKSLNNESIWALTKDRNKNFWVGTFGGGVNISNSESDFIIHYKSLVGAPNSLGHNIVKAFLEDENNQVWIATDGGGLNRFDLNTGKFDRLNTSNSNISSNAVLCLIHGEGNQIWMGTWAGGLVNFDKKTKKFQSFTTQNSQITDDNIHFITKDNEGNLWMGSQNGGLIHFNIKNRKFKAYLPENSNISHNRVTAVAIDKQGNLYLGATISMQVFNPNENQFTTYVNNPNASNSISNNYVIDILIQNDTCVWVATSDGLNRFNPQTKTFVNYFERNGLPNNLINAVALDQEGQLWVSTGNGLCWFDYRNNTFTNFNKSDGLQGNEFTDRSMLALTSNKIMVGGVNGFNIIFPEKIQANTKIPNVVITDLTIFNQKVPIGTKGEVLTKQISETKVLNLSYKQSVLTFYFAALDFTIPLKNQYAYMMEGFDADWIYCGNRTDATYTNLNPGKYIFRVKGSNNDGVWNETGTALEIIISPPWWKTKLALFSFGLFIIGMFLLFYFYRINSLKAQQKMLEKLVNERTNELSELNTELEETNEEVFQQKEELLTQADILSKTNKKLEKSTEELKLHKNNLEETVKIRTAELEKSKEKAEESDRLKSAFLANMSHEIRTPMNAIVGFSNLLNQPDLDENTKNNYVNQINENTASLCTLIDDILDISLMESNVLLIKKIEFEINILLDEVFLDATIQNPKSEIRLSNQVEDLHLKLFTDRFRLKQVLMNLINNGCKFTESGYVELGCFLKDNELVLFVKDTGIGISSENLEIIFDRFRKVLDDKTKLFRGVGLGLAISKKIAELLQGKLTCESELGIGSIFSLVLPNTLISTSKVEEPVPIKSNILNLEHKTILIVEDEETNYLYLESALKPTHATIIWAHDGKMALDLFLSAQQFHLVLMDIKMPRMNGYDATIAIKEMFPNQLIVAQTAYARPQDSVEIKQAGFDDYLIKPIIPNDLYRLLNKFF